MGSKTVFISYRRDAAGKGFAQAINLALTARGYDVFLDVITVAAGRWEKQILAQVPEQAHFLLLLTPGALDGCDDEKDWVRREFELAVRNNRNIVPVKEESVDLEQVRDSCPDSMKGVFEFQTFTVRHDAFIRDIEMLVSDYIAPHFAPQPRLDLSISRMLTEIFDGSTKRVVNSFGQSLKDRPLIIPVFGASGVGRTQILNGLLGNPIVKIDRYERTEFQVGHKPFRNPKIAESLSIVFVDTPGEGLFPKEIDRRVDRNRTLANLSDVPVLISVVANGFHEKRVVHDPDAVTTREGVLTPKVTYLETCRQHEATVLDDWVGGKAPPVRLLTVINKADMWWRSTQAEKSSVIEQYTDRDRSYGKVVAQKVLIPHSVVAYSAERHGYFYKALPSPDYSDAVHLGLHNTFVSTLRNFIQAWLEDGGRK